ncbi:MAG: type II toxin-antitoxin system prevent-host-death family antitoxin [Azoarcus sp.]|jgi:antitoxin (DNA-binding transcriptional repressor) of toxin-antitoxin stability system|nr:type II toxin-antitoxin system prevent-host-death family antitoxin [Azoarcus sp.]
MEATMRDLRLHTAEVLAATDRGTPVVITYRGKARAVLSRWLGNGASDVAKERNPAFGLWRDREGDVEEEVRRMRQPRELP